MKHLLYMVRSLLMAGGGLVIGDGIWGHKSTWEILGGVVVVVVASLWGLLPEKPEPPKPANPTPLIK